MSAQVTNRRQGHFRPLPFTRTVLVALGAAFLGGCTTLYEGKYDIEQGWREGTVVNVGAASAMTKAVTGDCRSSASAQQVATGRFATLTYRWMGRTLGRIVLLEPDVGIKAGDPVYVNVLSCATPLARRSA